MKEGEGFSESLSMSLEAKYEDKKEENVASVMQQEKAHPRQSPEDPHRKKKFENFSSLYILFMMALVVILAITTRTDMFMVLVALIPTILVVIVSLLIYESIKNNKNVLWVVPFILVFLFYQLVSNAGGRIQGLDVDVLTALNLLLSFLYLIINHFLIQSAPSTEAKDLPSYIASIEDKSKALNFVIGRVYSAYHGGNKDLREKISMKTEWYDQFSEISSGKSIDYTVLRKLIDTIEGHLRQLEKTESEVFGIMHRHFKHLARDEHGHDRIIDVLEKNDKDPVKTYYEGALEFCGKIRDYLSEKRVPKVKYLKK